MLRSYAWRFPFLAGIFLAIAGVKLQRSLQNDPDTAHLHGGDHGGGGGGAGGDGGGGGGGGEDNDGGEGGDGGLVVGEELKSIDPLRLLYKFYKLQMFTVWWVGG